MIKKNIPEKIKALRDILYQKLFKINDSPVRIAFGLGLGVASGIIPGTGPLAALFLAFIFKANRASALIGSLATNTWFSFVTFLLALRLGSAIFGVSWEKLQDESRVLFTDFKWEYLFKSSFFNIVLPLFIGYLIIALLSGILVYLVSWVLIKKIRHPA